MKEGGWFKGALAAVGILAGGAGMDQINATTKEAHHTAQENKKKEIPPTPVETTDPNPEDDQFQDFFIAKLKETYTDTEVAGIEKTLEELEKKHSKAEMNTSLKYLWDVANSPTGTGEEKTDANKFETIEVYLERLLKDKK